LNSRPPNPGSRLYREKITIGWTTLPGRASLPWRLPRCLAAGPRALLDEFDKAGQAVEHHPLHHVSHAAGGGFGRFSMALEPLSRLAGFDWRPHIAVVGALRPRKWWSPPENRLCSEGDGCRGYRLAGRQFGIHARLASPDRHKPHGLHHVLRALFRIRGVHRPGGRPLEVGGVLGEFQHGVGFSAGGITLSGRNDNGLLGGDDGYSNCRDHRRVGGFLPDTALCPLISAPEGKHM